jgi:DNA mismatch repair protein MutS
VAARTLFATHYHELNALAERLDRVRNYRIQVQEHDGEIIFLRKLVAGGADHSYGIEVARMAGLPDLVIHRAREILAHLEQQDLAVDTEGTAHPDAAAPDAEEVPDMKDGVMGQMSLFNQADPKAEALKEAVQSIDPNRMTPIEALMKIAELKEMLE